MRWFKDKTIKCLTFNSAKFLSLGLFSFTAGFGNIMGKTVLLFTDKKEIDKRGLTINHEYDNIPQIGQALFQDRSCNKIILNGESSIKSSNIFVEQLSFHKIQNYYCELKEKSKNGNLLIYKKNKDKSEIENDSYEKYRGGVLNTNLTNNSFHF